MISELRYRYGVCPHCKSKRIYSRQLSDPRSGCTEVQGYLCFNCHRFFTDDELIYIIDRAEMRRDRDRLTKLLATKRGK